jgi:hypothetical protein
VRQTSVASITVDDSDPRDASARCDRCGKQGTVVRVERHPPAPLILRYCGPCWPAAQKELEERQRGEQQQWRDAEREWDERRARDPEHAGSAPPPPAGWSGASRSWYDVQNFLKLISQAPIGGSGITSAQLAEVAAEIRDQAPAMDGPMPPDVEAFLARHRAG